MQHVYPVFIDALPYADTAPDSASAACARALIEAELAALLRSDGRGEAVIHPDVELPPPCPLLERYQRSAQPLQQNMPRESSDPVVLIENEVVRFTSLVALDEAGKSAWLRHNESIDGHSAVIEARTAEVLGSIKETNAKRKREQIEAMCDIQRRREEWMAVVAKCSAIQNAMRTLQ